MTAVIMAGGKGTRIASLAPDIPKPMLPIAGMPVLEHTVECLKAQGITRLYITVSHLGHIIMDYFGDGSRISPVTGRPFGVDIRYFYEEQPMGNAGALLRLRDELKEDFFLLNADLMMDIDFKRMMAFHRERGALATILTHPNSHPYDSGLIVADDKAAVVSWLGKDEPRPEYYRNRVNAGVHIISPELLYLQPIEPESVGAVKVDLDKMLLKPLAGSGRLFCYDSPEYVKDMGTPERYAAVQWEAENGLINKRNLQNRQKAVFLDRDGTLNRYVGFLRKSDELELLPFAAEGVKAINRAGYLCVVVTNQPVIARGEVSLAELEAIHNKLETLLGREGAYLDRIYFCPHHPDKGFAGEITELKIQCSCRKPKPGLLLRAAEELNIDLEASWMVGDSESDMLAGKAAGCRTVRITAENTEPTEPSASSILDFAQKYLLN